MSSATENISALSDEELRCELIKNGINAGPVGPSTRKVYETKLLKLLANVQQTEIVVNSIRGATPELFSTNGFNGSRHTSPAPQLNGSNKSTQNGHVSIEDNNHTVDENQQEADEQHSDEDEHEASDGFEESFRHLSPEEVIRFRSKFSAFRNSDVPPVANKATKAKTAFVAVALLSIVVFSLIIITKINFTQHYNSGEKDEI